jgi:hypothetical protein
MPLKRHAWSAILSAFLIAGGLTARADVVLTSIIPGEEMPVVEGNRQEADKAFTTASTFKMIVALAALEEGILAAGTKLACNDAHLPRRPMTLELREAMFFSSNDYFAHLARKLGNEQIQQMARACAFGNDAPPPKNIDDWAHGGNVRITPRQQHAFMRRLAAARLPADSRNQWGLQNALAWPRSAPLAAMAIKSGDLPAAFATEENPSPEFFGKTGSWDGIRWFTGYALLPPETKLGQTQPRRARIVTVLLTKPGSTRQQAIDAFYKAAQDQTVD